MLPDLFFYERKLVMKICHVCSAECEDTAELCPVCGADLTVEPDQEEDGAVTLDNPVLVATVEDVVTAEIFKDMLRDNGIPFTCGELDDGTMKVTFGGSFVADDIYVDDSDFERASEIYDELLNSEPEFDESFFEEETEDGEEE